MWSRALRLSARPWRGLSARHKQSLSPKRQRSLRCLLLCALHWLAKLVLMPKEQRLLKLCILLFTPITTVAAMGALAGTLWFGFSGEQYLAAVNAPSGRFRAVV